jgi:TonB family protein
MAPMSKETDVLTAPAGSTTATPSSTSFGGGTETSNRPLPVALEVPVTVNGARAVEGSDKREPFSETTKTVLVFSNGAVIRLTSPVAAGQLLFLTNEKTKKEVVCQVVKSKNYKNVSGYVELEFTESVVGFWGMRFPTDRIAAPVSGTVPAVTVPAPVKAAPPAPVSLTPKPVTPVVSAAPKLPELKPAQIQAELKPAAPSKPAEIHTVGPVAAAPIVPKPASIVPAPVAATTFAADPLPVVPAVQTAAPPVAPVVASFPIAPSLADSLSSFLSAPEPQAVLTPFKPIAPPVAASVATESKPAPAKPAADNSTEELKQQAARLQEQLSSLLFNAAPSAKPVAPAPVVPALDAKTVSNVAASVLKIAVAEPTPVKPTPISTPAPLAKSQTPAPAKSTLDTEEVKIPSWLEPLARNAATHAPSQESTEREKTKHTAEKVSRDEHAAELTPAVEQSLSESHAPNFGSLLPLDEAALTKKQQSGGSHNFGLIAAVAAAVLMAAAGGWYFFHQPNSAQGSAQRVAATSTPQTAAASPVTQAAPQNTPAAQLGTANSSPATTPFIREPAASAPLTKRSANPEPASVTRDNTRGAGTTIPAAVTERIAQPASEPATEPALEPKKPGLGEVHLASPTMNRPSTTQDDAVTAPAISADNAGTNPTGLGSGLATAGIKQNAGPEVPLPTGGDVKTAVLLSKVAPVYPVLAKNQHISGNVVIDALIDANGRVGAMKVLSGPALLQQAAMDALKQWKYQPASLDGNPVSVHLMVTLQFRGQ